MALDKLVDSGALDTSLGSTAQIVAAILMNLAGLTGQPDPMPFDLANGTGFGAAILAFTNAHPLSGSAAASPADVSGGFSAAAAGMFTLAANVSDGATYTIPHGLGVIPDVVLLFSPDVEPTDAWTGINNAIVILAANWALTEKRQCGVRARTGSAPQNAVASGGILFENATAAAVSFKSIATSATGCALAAGCRYYWFAAKMGGAG